MPRTTTIINFSAPPKLAKQIKAEAKRENKTQSELLRDAFSSYMFKKQLRKFQARGAAIAEKLGLETYDDIEEFFG
ncbi:hypothetical protein A2803_02105 [Candidatus Woesebacteria bacterium RIFCSPHIGHO2_01_FULL_44_21]|uniref:Ribbon-helix-helix protein CopG domain-containing protein n=1 Tax=Candidatus Woesebacteria bacterium RIFCSPHIGHO2_01_FULL_44_21 TaxID=1802503 RepID=A0A1F7YX56_9BACT|nr:MAG: hypothetical protein A2803_02105 [Candidatus Woesebacteria bacterium RIFCSPHIGHO2_01_FULL_44_21]